MKGIKLKKHILEFSLIMILGLSGSAVADVKNFGTQIPDEMDIVEALKPQTIVTQTKSIYRVRTRGLRPVNSMNRVDKPAASFGMTFGFNSAELTQASIVRLNKIGRALQRSELSNSIFRIEGYTDSLGSHSYNERLSRNRAVSTRNYLVKNFSINTNRLKIVGRGESDLLNKNNPEGSENRRVQIVNLGSI